MAKAYGAHDVCQRALSDLRMACRRFERMFSAFDPLSDVGRINHARGRWVPIARETYNVLEASLTYCACSQGHFDITAKPLVNLWDVHKAAIPPYDAIQQALAHVDYKKLKLKHQGNLWLARLEDPHAALDLGGVAKGWIADELCRMMGSYELTGFIVSLGGNVAARGCKPDGSPFTVGIRDPNNHSRTLGALPLRNCSAVASGVTERFFESDGNTYSHIIDVRTGRPIHTDVKSVTVVGKRSLDCDGFSTTLCALGMQKGAAFARELVGIDVAIFVSAAGVVVEASADRIVRIC